MSQGKWHRHSCLCPEPDTRLGITGHRQECLCHLCGVRRRLGSSWLEGGKLTIRSL